MARAKRGYIERYFQLYEYFEQHPNEYHVVKKLKDNTIVVYLKGPSGEHIKEMVRHPVRHGKLCVCYFHDVEVTNPKVTIPGIVIEEVIKRLHVPADIFKHYP